MSRRSSAKSKSTLRLLTAAVIVAAIVLLSYFAYTKILEYREIQTQEELKDLFHGTASGRNVGETCFSIFGTAFAEEETTDIIPTVVEEKYISERFAELYEINPEVIGWIEVGENISTPVVYRDNEFYLDHDFYGKESASGTVFADIRNEMWETDPYVVLYGHNMKNGTMFGTLDQYKSLDYLVENTKVDFHSVYNDEVVSFVPFAVVDASMDKDNAHYLKLRSFSAFENPEDMADVEIFLQELLDRSFFEIPGLDVTSEDRIFALVTCSYQLENARITVFCRQLREDETHEQMAEMFRLNARVKE